MNRLPRGILILGLVSFLTDLSSDMIYPLLLEKAYVAASVPINLRGTAFGYYYFIVGLGALPASLLFGLLWHTFGVKTAFLTGAALAITAAVLLFLTYYLDHAVRKQVPEHPHTGNSSA